MSLCRFYPSPSDRMAIIWSLMPIKDAVVLEYGPAGTTHFGGGMYSSLGLELGRSLFTTHISEDDIIMGDVSRLENAIMEIDEAYHPKIIFVVAAAVIAVIGSDIAGVCQYMQERVNARLISFEEGGFRGDYTYGLRAVYRMLSREVIKPAEKEEKTYNILGASAGSYRIRSDVWEIQNLMQEAFGWKCGYTMGLESSVSDVENAGGAALNLVIRNEALEAAEILQGKCGTPYYYGAPYGYSGTLKWLQDIAEIIGEEVNPALVARLKEKMISMIPMGGGPMMMRRRSGQASLQGDYDTLLGMRQALSEMDIETIYMVCSHSLKAIEKADEDVKFYAKEKERIELFQSLERQWCLGSDEMVRYTSDNCYFTLVSAPFVSNDQIACHLPFMGEKGMDYLRELKSEYFDKFGI